jgi:hypothetical protein
VEFVKIFNMRKMETVKTLKLRKKYGEKESD